MYHRSLSNNYKNVNTMHIMIYNHTKDSFYYKGSSLVTGKFSKPIPNMIAPGIKGKPSFSEVYVEATFHDISESPIGAFKLVGDLVYASDKDTVNFHWDTGVNYVFDIHRNTDYYNFTLKTGSSGGASSWDYDSHHYYAYVNIMPNNKGHWYDFLNPSNW